MITLHPNILENNGVKQFVILPYNEYLKIQELLEDFEDLKILRDAKNQEKNTLGISLSEARKELGI